MTPLWMRTYGSLCPPLADGEAGLADLERLRVGAENLAERSACLLLEAFADATVPGRRRP